MPQKHHEIFGEMLHYRTYFGDKNVELVLIVNAFNSSFLPSTTHVFTLRNVIVIDKSTTAGGRDSRKTVACSEIAVEISVVLIDSFKSCQCLCSLSTNWHGGSPFSLRSLAPSGSARSRLRLE